MLESNTTYNTASVSVSTSYLCITEQSYFFMTECTTNNGKHCDVSQEHDGSAIHCTCTRNRLLLDKVTDCILGWSKELYILHKSPTRTPWNQNVHYRFHITPLVHTLSQTNPIQVLRKTHFNIIFPTNLSTSKRSLLFRFYNYNFVRVYVSFTLATRLAMNKTSVHVTEMVIHIYSRLI